jgi:lysylphosphatidylglycerol synthetase-like protein (DUF2156 family)
MLDSAMGAGHVVLAVAILANGALGIIAVLATRFPEQTALLSALLPFGVFGLNRSLTLVLSLLLVYLAFEVYERRRAAWWSAAVVVLVGTVLHLARGEWAAALVGAATGGIVPATRHAAWFLGSLRLLGVVCAVLLVWSLFRPLAYRLRALSQEHADVEAIVSRHGRVPLDYFKLWPDKLYLFSPDRTAVVAYRTAWSVAVSLGDPVGPEDRLEALVRAFADFGAENGWKPAFHQVLPDLLPVYRGLGFGVLKIGEEAMVDLARFAAETSQHRTFRKPRRRLPAEGYRVVARRPRTRAHSSMRPRRSRASGCRYRDVASARSRSAASTGAISRGVRSCSLPIGPGGSWRSSMRSRPYAPASPRSI